MGSVRRAAVGALVFFFLAPANVAGLVPWWISRWRLQEPFLGWPGVRWIGAALVLAGLPVLISAFARFVRDGLGTPAPYQPTERLVVTGLYRFVRNPMYVAVVSAILGQALVFGSRTLLVYGGCVAAAAHLFVRLYEEPTLRKRYGADYERFCRNVRRWWPRLTPWSPGREPAR
jgi:protein-S-isoprenylcysteine O-methyltransferase Ste14